MGQEDWDKGGQHWVRNGIVYGEKCYDMIMLDKRKKSFEFIGSSIAHETPFCYCRCRLDAPKQRTPHGLDWNDLQKGSMTLESLWNCAVKSTDDKNQTMRFNIEEFFTDTRS